MSCVFSFPFCLTYLLEEAAAAESFLSLSFSSYKIHINIMHMYTVYIFHMHMK